jgi:hypothetical protein
VRRWNSFTGTLLYGALAASSVLATSFLPLSGMLGLHLVLIAGLYVVGVAPSAAASARAVVPTLVLAAGVWLASDHAGEAALGAALLVGVGRSVLVYRAPALRGLAVEAALIGAGLGLARALVGPGVGSLAWAIWGFFLVQSLYFWIPGIVERGIGEPETEPFERARRRLQRALDAGQARDLTRMP